MMAATNIFYRIPSQRGTRIASIAGTGCTLEQFCEYIIETEGLNRHDFIIASGTKVFRPSSCSLQTINLQNNSNVDILIPLLGGKGGFGSLLRAIGAQIEKTTNRDACRDLSGRRLRDIKREEELKRLIELREKLIEERKLRKKEKLEKLKKKSEKSKESSSIQELVAMFDDDAFNQRRLQLSEILDAAVEKGLINSRKRKLEEEANEIRAIEEKRSRLEGDGVAETRAITTRDKVNVDLKKPDLGHKLTLKKTLVKKNDLWLGLDEDVDDEDEDDDNDGSEVQAVN